MDCSRGSSRRSEIDVVVIADSLEELSVLTGK